MSKFDAATHMHGHTHTHPSWGELFWCPSGNVAYFYVDKTKITP